MPYIDKQSRERLQKDPYSPTNTPGELNYIITELIKKYTTSKGLSYQTVNDVLGALEGAKLEYYRRVAVDYENKKITENGDVY